MEYNISGRNPNVWKRRSSCLIKTLTITNILLFVVLFISFGVMFRLVDLLQKHQSTCQTPKCIETAADVLATIDQSVNPCDNFYNFACGGLIKRTLLSDEMMTVNQYAKVYHEMVQKLQAMINEDGKENEIRPFKMARRFFKSCMNRTRIEEEGIKPLIALKESLGGWPCVDDDNWDASWDWIRMARKARILGLGTNSLLSLWVGFDARNISVRQLTLDQPTLGLSREYIMKGLDDPIVKGYHEYMVDVAVILGADRTTATEQLYESLLFEIALANISLPLEKQRNYTELYNPMTIKQVQQTYPYLNWIEYISNMLPDNVTVDEDEIVNVRIPSFFKALGNLLERTPKITIANYLFWRVAESTSYYLNEQLRLRRFAFSSLFSGRKEFAAWWIYCTETTNEKFHYAVGSLYVRKHFNNKSKKAVHQAFEFIRAEFRQNLQEVSWMDNVTREAAIRKLDLMTSHIGYADEILDDEKLSDYYEQLDIHPEKFFSSIMNINGFFAAKQFKVLREPVNKTSWYMYESPTTVNAFYDSNRNGIEIPAGILQNQFYSSGRPEYMNYGAIGFIIGHEITHGFDDMGRQYDADGKLSDWWQPKTSNLFLKKAQCIIDQYGNYTDEATNLKLNGVHTQGENIADNGATKQSYRAYKRWEKLHGKETKLPGLPYSTEQMFWISAAQIWCAYDRPEFMKVKIRTDSHALEQFRVIGSLGNNDDFARDFNCPVGSPMNPTNKCEVW